MIKGIIRFFNMTEEIAHLSQRKKMLRVNPFYVATAILFIVLLGGAAFFGYQYFILQKQFQNSPAATQKAAQEEARKLVAEVGKLMVLPNNELPTVATVTDINKLKDQVFFQQAKNGNKVLIFTNAKLAILYDPQIHKIVNVGPVNIGTQPNQPTQAKIDLRNGTDINGLTTKVDAQLQKAFPGLAIVKKEQGTNSTYDRTIVVALNPIAKDAALTLAKFFNASVVDLPSQEEKPDSIDILIILGKDRSDQQPSKAAAISITPSPSPTK